jgi:hypothetical protein
MKSCNCTIRARIIAGRTRGVWETQLTIAAKYQVDAYSSLTGFGNMQKDCFDRTAATSVLCTFLISMSYPIINLPIERIERHRSRQEQGYADDSYIDPELAVTVWRDLGGKKLRETLFFNSDTRSFCQSDVFNISDGLPERYAEILASREGSDSAGRLFR